LPDGDGMGFDVRALSARSQRNTTVRQSCREGVAALDEFRCDKFCRRSPSGMRVYVRLLSALAGVRQQANDTAACLPPGIVPMWGSPRDAVELEITFSTSANRPGGIDLLFDRNSAKCRGSRRRGPLRLLSRHSRNPHYGLEIHLRQAGVPLWARRSADAEPTTMLTDWSLRKISKSWRFGTENHLRIDAETLPQR
jgi:hypothetical protein